MVDREEPDPRLLGKCLLRTNACKRSKRARINPGVVPRREASAILVFRGPALWQAFTLQHLHVYFPVKGRTHVQIVPNRDNALAPRSEYTREALG